MSTIAYRPDIDGLRAVAVLSVLLCHAGFSGFGGGYVGVDVFFVISGFLITSLIMADLQKGTFSFAGFWERRCRRILPPLAVVMAACAVAGWFCLLPSDYDGLGQQIAAQAVFASNILFKTQAGYFDAASQTKPLLHTWSLAVEEQFYLVLPVVMFLIWRWRRERMVRYLAVVAVVTFIGTVFIIRNSPSSAFFLLPFRAWELLIGSLLALRPPAQVWGKRANEALAAAGLIAILLPVYFYTEDTVFPGFAALPPCLGTAAVILANRNGQTYVGRMLSRPGVVFIGLISYSLYLWHWPLIAFARYSEVIPFTTKTALICIALSFAMAILTWHFIEKPVRRKRIFMTQPRAYAAALTVILMAGIVGLLAHQAGGFPKRIDPVVVQLAEGTLDSNPNRKTCDKPELSRFDTDDVCQLNAESGKKPELLIWGDSLADALAPAFYDLAREEGVNGYIVTAHGCPAILGYGQLSKTRFDCAAFNARVLDLVDRKNIRKIYLVSNWMTYLQGDNFNFADMGWYEPYAAREPHVTTAAFRYTLDELKRRGVDVRVVVDTPYAPFDPPRYLALRRLYKAFWLPEAIPLESYVTARAQTIDRFMDRNKDANVAFIDPKDTLCNDAECAVQDDGHSLYYNPGHLSAYGARYLARGWKL